MRRGNNYSGARWAHVTRDFIRVGIAREEFSEKLGRVIVRDQERDERFFASFKAAKRYADREEFANAAHVSITDTRPGGFLIASRGSDGVWRARDGKEIQ